MTAVACLIWSIFAHAQVPDLSPSSPPSAGTMATAEGNTLQIKRIANSQLVMLNFVNADVYSVFRAVGSSLLRLQGIAEPENERSMLVVTQTDANNTSSGYSAKNLLIITDYAENVRHLARPSSDLPAQYTDHERPSLWSFSDLRPREQSKLLVLVLLGVVLAVPFISVFTGCDKKLRTEAERLAQLLTLAYEKVQLTGQTIVWEGASQKTEFKVR